MRIVSRSQWGARPPARVSPVKRHDNWFIHWEGGGGYPAAMSEAQIMQSIQRFHMQTRGWRDIAYHFIIFNSGNVYEGAGWGNMGTATKGRNSTSHAIMFVVGPGRRPSQAALDAAAALIEAGRVRGYAPVTRPHSAAVPTACPGPELTAWARAYKHTDPSIGATAMNRSTVEQLYRDLLGREGDPDGVSYWTGVLDRGEMTVLDLRWHFLAVRLAADKAAIEALAARTGGPGVDPAVVARQAYDNFLADLRAFVAAKS